MKKLLTILLSVCVAFTCATLVACTDEPSSNGTGTQVTAQEYATALQLNGDFRLVMEVVDGEGTTTTTYTNNGDKIELMVVNGGNVSHGYFSKEDNNYFAYNEVGGDWIKTASDEQTFNYYKSFPTTVLRMYTSTEFESFNYDETEKCYKMTQTAEVMSGTFKIFFNNKKVVKFITSVTNSAEGETVTTETTFTYNVKITLPDQGGEEKGENTLTASNYTITLSLSALNCTADCRYISSYGTEHTIWTIYNGNLYMQSVIGDTVVYEDYYSKEGNAYYYYEKDSDTGMWTKESIEESYYLGQMSTCDFNLIFSFEDWTFDSETGKYVCASKIVEIYGDTYNFTDAYLIIKDGKMVECGMKDGNDVYTYNISYEGTVINLPVIE